MSDEIIEVESISEKVVHCPRCGQRNRMFPQAKAKSYRCAKCRARMGNPFSKDRLKQTVLWSAGLVGGVALAAGVTWWAYSENLKNTTADPPALPPSAPAPSGPPINGAVLKGPDRVGEGSLTVNDILDCDAVVKISASNGDSTNPMLFYVQKHRAATLRGIPDGRFCVMFSTGGSWDALLETFTQDDLYFQFDRALEFNASHGEHDLTLGGIGPGQAFFSPITKPDFAR